MVDAVEDYAIYMIDPDGTVLTWNSGAERNKGYKPDEIIGKNYACFFPPEAQSAGDPQRQLEEARLAGKIRKEGWRIRKDGSRFWAVVTLTAMRDAAGHLIGFAKVTKDLTERHEQDVALRAAMDDARIANAAKSDFLANMSHELRTPLNAIIGFSEMLLSQVSGPLTDKNREYAGHIHGSGHHLLSLINDLLDFAKLEAKAMTLIRQDEDLCRIAQEAIDIIQPQADKGGVHATLDTAGPAFLLCDARRMLQIFLNLLSNAVKFTGDGGHVTLRVRDEAGAVIVTVQDTGIGMDPEEIPLALSRFGQIESVMSRKAQGTGLGLPLVKQLVELHGGNLQLTSRKHEGTSVVLVFPRAG